MFETEKKTYISVDIFTNHDQAVGTLFKFLNFLNLLGFPLHKFDLKIDAFIINMRNLNAYKQYKEMRLRMLSLNRKVIQAEMYNESDNSQIVYL